MSNPRTTTKATTGTSRTAVAAPPTTAPATMAQAKLYQQLRSHLATLKLLDAAEHLPAVLDAGGRTLAHDKVRKLAAAVANVL